MKVTFQYSKDGFLLTVMTEDLEKYEIVRIESTVIVSKHDEPSRVFDCSHDFESSEAFEILCHFMRSYPPKTLCSDCVEDILRSCGEHIESCFK